MITLDRIECKIYGDMSRDPRSRSRRRRSGESKRRLRTVYTEVGRGKDSNRKRPETRVSLKLNEGVGPRFFTGDLGAT